MDDWLVSVISDGKVIDLYLSEDLCDLNTIRAMHKGCDVEAMHIAVEIDPYKRGKIIKETRLLIPKRVRCFETKEIFASVSECSNAVGASRWSIYKAVRNGFCVDGKHYNYVNESSDL